MIGGIVMMTVPNLKLSHLLHMATQGKTIMSPG